MDNTKVAELQFLGLFSILKFSFQALYQNPKPFYQMALTLIFPLLLFQIAFLILISPLNFFDSLVLAFALLILLYVYAISLRHVGSVVSGLETNIIVYGFVPVKDSYDLFKGEALISGVLGFGYFLIYGVVNMVFELVVVLGESSSVFVKVVVGGFLIGFLLIFNLVALLIQSGFCSVYHPEEVDKTASWWVSARRVCPVKTSVQIENVGV